MKGSHGLIGVGRAWCYAINTKRSRSNGNPMDSGPTVYMRWSVSPLRAPDNHLEPFVYCKPLLQPCWRKYLGSHSNLLGEFFDSLPLRLGGSRLTPSLSVRPHRKQKEKVESDCWSSYCGQSSCLAHTQLRSASQLDVRLALTLTGAGSPHHITGSGSGAWRPVSSQAWVTPSPHYSHCVLLELHLFIARFRSRRKST